MINRLMACCGLPIDNVIYLLLTLLRLFKFTFFKSVWNIVVYPDPGRQFRKDMKLIIFTYAAILSVEILPIPPGFFRIFKVLISLNS